MKAHEETWTAHPQGGFIRDGSGSIIGDVTALDEREDMSERTLLMAAAPDMARALLRVAKSGVNERVWNDEMGSVDDMQATVRAALKKAGVL